MARNEIASRSSGMMIRNGGMIAAALLAFASPLVARPPDGGQVMPDHAASDRLTPEQDRAILEKVSENIAKLSAKGIVLPTDQRKVDGLVWPLGPDPGVGRDWHGISNFVDLNPAYPNQVRDYTCGTRSYDLESGYNHAGIDYFIWPFPWHLMDTGAVDVRAVAPGTLVAAYDGHNDRSCSLEGAGEPNYAVVQHGDGTIALYLHMKRGSVTTLPVGSAISAGQVLGKVGSSGMSTGPHLHLELRAGRQAGATVIEPHRGECNAVTSAWPTQREYRETRINRLSTHSAAPASPSCPDPHDQPNFKDNFAPGDPIVFLAAYRDIVRGKTTRFRVVRPDGSAYADWNFDMAESPDAPDFYNGGYWHWNNTLPADAQTGQWTLEATLDGRTTRHAFSVGAAQVSLDDPRGLIGSWYEPATSGQGFEVQWLEGDLMLVYFYGHRDDGSNLFLLGTHQGTFEFGDALEITMAATTGGSFTEFDPDAIERSEWGTLTLTFESCEQALATLSGDDGEQSLVLERLGRTPGLTCD